ncbi:MAG: heavy-metal-associated domain-containing protein [Anaerolineaceae bacterium]|nr:heavy-metal-associated domain-containing protein [Anaerolineaceae bacterium]
METITVETKALYADHHVTEVRRILLEIPGVMEVYASSAFQAIQIGYDPMQVDEARITAVLDDAGYLLDLMLPEESGNPAYGSEQSDTFFRHTSAYAQTRMTVGFAQKLPYAGRPLWPCPGVGVVKNHEGDN